MAPGARDHGAHGAFDTRAGNWSPQLWTSKHHTVLALGFLAFAVSGLIALSKQRSVAGIDDAGRLACSLAPLPPSWLSVSFSRLLPSLFAKPAKCEQGRSNGTRIAIRRFWRAFHTLIADAALRLKIPLRMVRLVFGRLRPTNVLRARRCRSDILAASMFFWKQCKALNQAKS